MLEMNTNNPHTDIGSVCVCVCVCVRVCIRVQFSAQISVCVGIYVCLCARVLCSLTFCQSHDFTIKQKSHMGEDACYTFQGKNGKNLYTLLMTSLHNQNDIDFTRQSESDHVSVMMSEVTKQASLLIWQRKPTPNNNGHSKVCYYHIHGWCTGQDIWIPSKTPVKVQVPVLVRAWIFKL